MPDGFEIRVKKSAQKELLHIHQPDFKRLSAKIQALSSDPIPSDAVRLTGTKSYRIRQGDWRVIYEVLEAERVVMIQKVAHRREAYREI